MTISTSRAARQQRIVEILPQTGRCAPRPSCSTCSPRRHRGHPGDPVARPRRRRCRAGPGRQEPRLRRAGGGWRPNRAPRPDGEEVATDFSRAATSCSCRPTSRPISSSCARPPARRTSSPRRHRPRHGDGVLGTIAGDDTIMVMTGAAPRASRRRDPHGLHPKGPPVTETESGA
jgi:hypothetical protein